MTRKPILCSVAFGAIVWWTAAPAQSDSNLPAAATPPAAGATPAAPTASPSSPGDDVIRLHMPTHRRVHAAPPPTPAETPTIDSIGADTTTAASPAPVETQPPAPTVETKPARKSDPDSVVAPVIPFSFGEDSQSAAPPPAPSPQKASVSRAAPATRTASLPPETSTAKTSPGSETAPPRVRAKNDEHAGLAKRGAVLFDKGVSNPSAAQFKGVKLLASDVSTALERSAARVQLEAYGGTPGDKSSEARRLSLKRALAVRQLLIDGGIPSNRIDVRAMGGVVDKGPNDRVDVFVGAS